MTPKENFQFDLFDENNLEDFGGYTSENSPQKINQIATSVSSDQGTKQTQSQTNLPGGIENGGPTSLLSNNSIQPFTDI